MYRSKALARATALQWTDELVSKLATPVFQKIKISGVSFNQVVDLWSVEVSADIELGNKRRSSIAKSIYYLNSISSFLGKVDIALIDESKLCDYQLTRTRLGRRPSTINSEMGTLSLILHWAKKHNFIGEAPTVWQISNPQMRLDLPAE